MEPQNRGWWGGGLRPGAPSAEATAIDAGNTPPSGRPWTCPGPQDRMCKRAGEGQISQPTEGLTPPQPPSHPALLPGSPHSAFCFINEENPPRVIQAPLPPNPSILPLCSICPTSPPSSNAPKGSQPVSPGLREPPPHPANRTYRRRAQHTCEFTHVHTHDCHIRRPPVRAPGVGRQHTPPPRPVDLSTKSWTSICTEGLRVHGAGAQLRH